MTGRRKRVLAAVAASTMVIGGATFAIAANPAPETYAFVARGDDHADALAASSLAGRLNAPIVLTRTSSLPDAAKVALQSADPDNVIIAGGTAAVSADVENAIRLLLPAAKVERAFGSDRYATAQQLAAKFPQIDPSWLAVDGKANAAEEADDSAMFGGLAPTEYQHTWGNRIDEPRNFTYDADGVAQIMPPLTFTVPVEGFMEVMPGWAIPQDASFVYYVLDDPGFADLDNSLVRMSFRLVTDTLSFPHALDFPTKVAPGEHTLTVWAFGEADTADQVGARQVAVRFTAGMTGTWEPYGSSAGTTSSPEDVMERMGVQRGG